MRIRQPVPPGIFSISDAFIMTVPTGVKGSVGFRLNLGAPEVSGNHRHRSATHPVSRDDRVHRRRSQHDARLVACDYSGVLPGVPPRPMIRTSGISSA